MGSRTTFYRSTGVVLARASTDPGGLELPDDLDGDSAACREWLARLWHRAEVRAALKVASPVLSQQIDAVLAGEVIENRRLVSLLGSVSSYLRRWQRRATPFGLFAGVAAASVGTAPTPLRHEPHRITARADARWLGRIVDDLEQRTDLLKRLSVVVNNAGFIRGDRFVIPTRPDETQPGKPAALDVAVRLSKPVHAALAAADTPRPLAAVAHRIAEKIPHATSDRIYSLLTDLVSRRALITNLRAPMTTVDALAHLIAELEAADAGDLPDLGDLIKQLSTIRDELPCDAPSEPSSLAALAGAAERMREVRDAEKTLAVDVALQDQLTVPDVVLQEAESAATALLRLTQHPFGTPAWRDFHARFLDRYGAGTQVAVRDVIADSGLGFPAGWLGAPRLHSPHLLTERDGTLLALIQRATADGQREITLTQELIDRLRVGDHDNMVPPERVELAFQLHARSSDALARGRFQLWVTGAMHAGSMAGRFAHVLPDADRHRLAGTYEPGGEHTIAAQLSFPPRREHNENITRVPELLPKVLSLSEHHGNHGSEIDIDDLAVTADHQGLSLVRLSTGQRVRPWVLHALETSAQTPPLARFLAEVPSARCGFYGLLDFGAAREMPFLPRVRYGRTVLSPAQWRLGSVDLPQTDAEESTWDIALAEWRDRWQVPASVLLVEGEQRLPLDLDDRHDRMLLRRRLDRSSNVIVRESGDHQDHAWAGRVCEFLVPLTAAGPVDNRPRTAAHHTITRSDAHLPGNTAVLRADLRGHPWRFNDILTTYLPHLLHAVEDHAERWWFSRHHDSTRPDSDQYLVLSLRLHDPGQYGAAAARLADWAAQLRDAGLLADLALGTYQPPGTFGHGPANEAAAEEVFAADSAVALAQLHWASGTGPPIQAAAAASMADIAASLAPSPEAGYRWLCELIPQEHGKLDRSLREAALRLTAIGSLPELSMIPAGHPVATAWQRRRAALAAFRDQHRRGPEPAIVLRTLLHDHHLRGVGVDPGTERLTNRLARVVAQRQLALLGRGYP
ncbi:lantibiotic dehydratase [Saccharopolyspora phatthalungensis]|uniref:Thiopeptide-type bacteriocin biosynthesis protein n=1 Tax=Saccharopolyspora phatthalungensis TaxID=664693 RepID=A0A840Q5R2_9PSEU|nr:lantibiotic dehydratase [Saccharopolyspora phatthalungensis]MBB5155954.1 thiopeptide-type bacteriocin biosynthesis protein [Saccharopolyspora phatthalungensis]